MTFVLVLVMVLVLVWRSTGAFCCS